MRSPEPEPQAQADGTGKYKPGMLTRKTKKSFSALGPPENNVSKQNWSYEHSPAG